MAKLRMVPNVPSGQEEEMNTDVVVSVRIPRQLYHTPIAAQKKNLVHNKVEPTLPPFGGAA